MKDISSHVRPKAIYALALALLMILLASCQKSPTIDLSSSRHNDAQESSNLEPLDQSSVNSSELSTSKMPSTSTQIDSSSESTIETTETYESETSRTSMTILYYVRTRFDDPRSQTGAFSLYENAVKLATDQGQSVFDLDGHMLYTAAKPTPESTIPSPVPTEPVSTKAPSPMPTPISIVNKLPNTRHGWTFPPSEETIFVLAKYGAYAYGPADSKSIYLTFNAGYEHNQNSVKILDILARHQVKAVFFLDGYYMESNPDTVKRMVNEGHIVGNHTRRHADLIALLDSGREEEALAQIKGFDDLYRSITGFEPSNLYRPPSSEWSERTLGFVQNLGYRIYLFSWTHKDWLVDEQPSSETVLQKLKGQVFPGSILMLHSVGDSNVAILEDFISYVHQQGYSFALLPVGH